MSARGLDAVMNRVISRVPGTTGRVNKPRAVITVKLDSNNTNATDEISSPLSTG